MKKVIGKIEYNTESAVLVAKYTEGYLGDPTGFEESLYQTEDGKYFLYVNGGESSPYPEENIKRMGKAKAEEWKISRNV